MSGVMRKPVFGVAQPQKMTKRLEILDSASRWIVLYTCSTIHLLAESKISSLLVAKTGFLMTRLINVIVLNPMMWC